MKSSSTKDKKRGWDKRYFCVFCEKAFLKITRHLEDIHKSETEVARLINLAVNSEDSEETKKLKTKLRKQISDSLRQKGTFNHNIKVLNQGFGEITVKRCPVKETAYTEFLPCEFCLQFYFRKDLHRHVKGCSKNKNVSKHPKASRVQSRASMLLPVHPQVSNALKQIFERMKIDDVSMLLKLDMVIIKYGNVLCRKHYNNDDQTYFISNKLRELGRLLFLMKSLNIVSSFEEIINPKLYPEVMKAVTNLCGWDEAEQTIETPSLGIKLGQLLIKVPYLFLKIFEIPTY